MSTRIRFDPSRTFPENAVVLPTPGATLEGVSPSGVSDTFDIVVGFTDFVEGKILIRSGYSFPFREVCTRVQANVEIVDPENASGCWTPGS